MIVGFYLREELGVEFRARRFGTDDGSVGRGGILGYGSSVF